MPEGGLAIVLNVKDLDGAKNRILINEPRHIIRKARIDEIRKLKAPLDNMLPTALTSECVYESNWEEKKDLTNLNNINYTRRELHEKDWKYYVIKYNKGTNRPIIDLQNAFLLLDKEVLLGPQIICGGYTWPKEYHFLHGNWFFSSKNFFMSITENDASMIRQTYSSLQKHDNEIFDIKNRIDQLRHLYSIPLSSPLRIVGYFTIIESVLAHKPDPKDPLDSITKQIKRNFNLLNNRYKNEINLNNYFGDIKFDTIWTKLYALRSTIAHGGKPDFQGEFQALKDHTNVIFFLHEVVKKTLYQSLIEPELIRDLK